MGKYMQETQFRDFYSLLVFVVVLFLNCAAIAKDIPHESQVGQGPATKSPVTAMDPHAHGQHNQVERQASSLAPYQTGIVVIFI
jgi:hypothetical protein